MKKTNLKLIVNYEGEMKSERNVQLIKLIVIMKTMMKMENNCFLCERHWYTCNEICKYL